jgi:UDP-N-acetylmuramyl-tripeptide synthetase
MKVLPALDLIQRFCIKNINAKELSISLNTSTIVGPYNAENILGAFACAHQLGVDPVVVKNAIERFSYVPGRLEQFRLSNGAIGIVDYAHNPSSFQALFSMLRQNTDDLWIIFGCGGSRDATKRPIMGELAARYGDKIIITTDNPRHERVEEIVKDIVRGISEDAQKTLIIELDRAKAISRAIENSRKGSIIAVVGKGPDEYQQIGSEKTFFSDRQEMIKFV